MIIKEILEFTTQIHTEIKDLLSQLTNREVDFSNDILLSILKSNNSFLFGAFESNKLVGILDLVVYNIPTGRIGRIEDVVVDSALRGKGIGKALSLFALNKGLELNLDRIFLTSNPSRIAANKLYRKIGFQLGETNSYFYAYKK